MLNTSHSRPEDCRSQDLFQFAPGSVNRQTPPETLSKVAAAYAGFSNAIAAISGDTVIAQAAQTEGDGLDERKLKKSGNTHPAAGLGLDAAPQGPLAPTDGTAAIQSAEQQLAGFMSPGAQYQGTQMYPGPAQVPGQAMLGGQYALGFPIASGKLGNGPGSGGLGGVGGVVTEKAAQDKYAALEDLNCGDLVIRDRDDLGIDIHDRMAGTKLAFLTQGGELGLMEYLRSKYPEGRDSSNVLLGHKVSHKASHKAAGDAGCGTLDVSAVGEGDYSKLRVCPYNTYGKVVLDEIDSRLNSQAKKTPTDKLEKMDYRDSDCASSEKCSAEQNRSKERLEKLLKRRAPVMHNFEDNFPKSSLDKQANILDSIKGWDPTLKAGLGGAALGGGVGGLAGAFGALGGGDREPIDEDTARQLLANGVSADVVYKLLNPDEGELDENEIGQLTAAGFQYDDIAPQSGGMMSGGLKGGLLGAGLGGLAGAGLQEGTRLLGGAAVPGLARDKVEPPGWLSKITPDFIENPIKNWGKDIAGSAGGKAWNALGRQGQFDAVQDNVPFNLPSTMTDNALNKIQSWTQ